MSLTIKFLYGGTFYLAKDPYPCLCYKKKSVFRKEDVDPDLLSRIELESFVKDLIALDAKEFWYCKADLNLNRGLEEIKVDRDILELCKSGGYSNILDVYVVTSSELSPHSLLDFANGRTVQPNAYIGSPSAKVMKLAQRRGPAPSKGIDTNLGSQTEVAPPIILQELPRSLATPRAPGKVNSIPLQKQKALASTSRQISYEDEDVDEDVDDDVECLGSESSDSDDSYVASTEENVFGSESDEDDDDAEFVKFVDDQAIDEGLVGEDGQQVIDDVFDIRVDSEGYESYTGSDDNLKVRYPEFNPLVDFGNKICFKNGMRFGSNEIFRKALRQYALENGFDYYYLHNDNNKVSAYCLHSCECGLINGRKRNCSCKVKLCGFRACARSMGSDGTFQLKSFCGDHQCGWQDRNTKMTSKWLAEKYLERYRDDPHWRIKTFMLTIRREHSVEVTYVQAWRARVRAILMTQGYAPEQYAKVWDYAATILKYNPGSSVYVRPEEGPERPMKFQRFYVCLKACKEGFLKGCRPVIGLDGCHLKGAYTGQVLTAVAKDGNENIFPVAYAVVESETKATWCWFLEILLNDIGGKPLTFMSDRQKGLIEAIAEVAPTADTRVCVRHLHNNFKKQWPGKSFKDAVWAAARATTKADFEKNMKIIKSMDAKAEKYLLQQDPSTWSLHAFKTYTKSAMLLNNGCESFNSCILEAREMPILSMCEWIRRKLMKMFISKRNKMRRHQGLYTPESMKKIEDSRVESVYKCKCHGDGDKYEVDCGASTFVVDLGQRSCGCYVWDLTGLPCTHAISCILKRRLHVEDYIDAYYLKDTYMAAYNLSVNPMPGESQWETTNYPILEPPKLVIQPGRPKKVRRKEPGEEAKNKKKRLRVAKNKCSNCLEEGHSKRTCKNPTGVAEPTASTRKGGRPRSDSTMPIQPQKRKYTRRKPRPTIPAEEVVEEVNPDQANVEQDIEMQAIIENAMNEDADPVMPPESVEEMDISIQYSQNTMPPPPSQPSQLDAPNTSVAPKRKNHPTRKTRASTSKAKKHP